MNEKRELVGYDKVSDGDVMLVPAGLVSLEDATAPLDFGNPDDTRSADPDLEVKAINPRNPRARRREVRTMKRLRRGFERLMEVSVARLFEQEGDRVADLFEQFGQGRALEEIVDGKKVWAEKLGEVNRKAILFFADRTLKQVKASIGPDEIKADADQVRTLFEELSERYARELSAEGIAAISDETRKQIRSVIEHGINEGQQLDEIADAIREKFDDFSEGRVKTIARTEVHNAQNFAQLESANKLNIPGLKKVWLWSGVSRPEHAEMDGISVEVSHHFSVGSVAMARPGDPAGGPKNVINCSCVLAFERD